MRKLALLVLLAACSKKPENPPPADPLFQPSHPEMNRTAPAEYRVKFETSKGDFVLRVVRAWAPNGADRFYNLAQRGFYDGCRFFRVVENFVAQFGVPGNPNLSGAWREATIPDDPRTQSNLKGTITFAKSDQPHSRTTQVFLNLKHNPQLDGMGFAPFGMVVEGIEVVDALYSGYGDGAPEGRGPYQSRVQTEGNGYLERDFPRLDFIQSARVIP